MPDNLNHKKLLEKTVEVFTSQIFEISHKFSQTLLWASGGAISLSIAAIESMNKDFGILFIIAVVCFVVTIFLVLFSWFCAQKALKTELIEIYKNIDPLESKWREHAERSTNIASFVFSVGVVLLTCFFLSNANMSNPNNGKDQSNQKNEANGRHSQANQHGKFGGTKVNKSHETKFVLPPLPKQPKPPAK